MCNSAPVVYTKACFQIHFFLQLRNERKPSLLQVNALTAEVPVGCLEDGFLVSTTTLVTYSLCSIAIAYYVFMHGKKPRSD
ncbi:hypothetical protein MRX96_033235 [Rhipicephalus microplus]